MEEAQAQTAEHLMQEIAHIDYTLAQVTQLVQNHIGNQRDAVQAFAPANPQSPAFQVTQPTTSAPTAVAPVTPEANRSYRVRPHSASLSRLRSRSSSMTTMQGISIAEDHPLHAPDDSDAVTVTPQAPAYLLSQPATLSAPEPYRVLDAPPVSPEIKECYLVRSSTGASLQPRSSNPVLLRQRSSSMTRLQATIIAEEQPLGTPAQTDAFTRTEARTFRPLRGHTRETAREAQEQHRHRQSFAAWALWPGAGLQGGQPRTVPTPLADQFWS